MLFLGTKRGGEERGEEREREREIGREGEGRCGNGRVKGEGKGRLPA